MCGSLGEGTTPRVVFEEASTAVPLTQPLSKLRGWEANLDGGHAVSILAKFFEIVTLAVLWSEAPATNLPWRAVWRCLAMNGGREDGGEKTAKVEEEEEENGPHHAPRGQKTPPPKSRQIRSMLLGRSRVRVASLRARTQGRSLWTASSCWVTRSGPRNAKVILFMSRYGGDPVLGFPAAGSGRVVELWMD